MTIRELRLLVGGQWVSGDSEPVTLHSPATGEALARVHQGDRRVLDRAVDAAWSAHRELARMTAFERAALTHRVADLLEDRAETIAHDLSAEHGKPMASEAVPEIAAAVDMFRDAAEGVKRLETAVIPSADAAKRVITIRQPRGVYGLLTPWNFPVTIPSEYLSAGLATGNAMVWKPSELTPMSAEHLARCFLDAGVPAGTLNLLHGDPAEIGGGIAGHERIVAAKAAGKPLLFELGGNCPVIVFDDANLDTVIEKLAFGCFANAGQICDSVERILVHERIEDDLVAGLAEAASRLRLGSPFDESTTLGPVINELGAARIDAHLADARTKGATVVLGGGRATGHPTDLYYQPTVITGVLPGMRIEAEETFGPVAATMSVADEEEAIAAANLSTTGLVGAVFTRDIGRAMRVAEALETGMVNVNDSTAYWQPHTPFGGFSGKQSGVGRLGGRWTLEEMTQVKTINIDVT